jgi:hypothetical protein
MSELTEKLKADFVALPSGRKVQIFATNALQFLNTEERCSAIMAMAQSIKNFAIALEPDKQHERMVAMATEFPDLSVIVSITWSAKYAVIVLSKSYPDWQYRKFYDCGVMTMYDAMYQCMSEAAAELFNYY